MGFFGRASSAKSTNLHSALAEAERDQEELDALDKASLAKAKEEKQKAATAAAKDRAFKVDAAAAEKTEVGGGQG